MSNNKKATGLSVLSKYRGEVCGLAIISVLIFHYRNNYSEYAKLNDLELEMAWTIFTKWIGSIGVDLFLFFSGFGLFFSMKRDSNVLHFYKKRLIRILIPYLLFVPAIFYVVDIYYLKADTVRYWGDVTQASFWMTGRGHFWYVSFSLVLYLIFPLFFWIINRKGWRGLYNLYLIILPVLFILGMANGEAFQNIEIAITRIPIFLFGILWGKYAYEEKRWSFLEILLILSGVIFRIFYVVIYVAALNNAETPMLVRVVEKFTRYFIQWHAVGMAAVLCISFQYIMPKFLGKILRWFGSISLELYITHIGVRLIFKLNKFPLHIWWCYLGGMVIALVLAVIVNKLSNLISSLISRN